MSIPQGFKIESDFALVSDWLPKNAFTAIYGDRSAAIAIAIEGVDEPGEQEVRVLDAATGKVVWRSTDEEYE